jgi:hypothetical protein
METNPNYTSPLVHNSLRTIKSYVWQTHDRQQQVHMAFHYIGQSCSPVLMPLNF